MDSVGGFLYICVSVPLQLDTMKISAFIFGVNDETESEIVHNEIKLRMSS